MNRMIVAVGVLFVSSGCGTNATASWCGPDTCGGCCNGDVCESGGEGSACGLNAAACDTCVSGQVCKTGRCVGGGVGGGGGGGGVVVGGGGVGGVGGGSGGGGPSCVSPLVACGGACVDTRSDPNHCGACSSVCGASCASGACVTLPTDCTLSACPALGYYCDLSSKQCKQGCVTDSQCSGPLNRCDPGTRTCGCEVGSCGATRYCTAARACATGCEQNSQCAGATNVCNAAHQCVECATMNDCSGSTPYCRFATGKCVECLSQTNCGAPFSGTAVCTTTNTCTFSCNTGFHQCGIDCRDNTSITSCGTSCSPCPMSANGTATCDGITCGMQCAAGYELAGMQCIRVAGWGRLVSNAGPEGTLPAASFSGNGVIVFGGTLGFSLNETWRWNPIAWTKLSPSVSPGARNGHAMAFDSARAEVILFGGSNNGVLTADTWAWIGNAWVNRPGTGPTTREEHAMAFDSVRNRLVLFGGFGTTAQLNDTWEWDGSSWAQKTPATRPTARAGHSMAFDSVRGKVVLFAGYNSSGQLAETWEWDGTNWTLRMPATSPSKRAYAAMVFDSSRGRVVLFGGSTGAGAGTASDQTWEYDGTTWVMRALPLMPGARFGHTMAYDPVRNRTVMVGGRNATSNLWETWEY